MAEVTLEMLGELMQRMLGEMREMRGEMAEFKDQQLVQGGILLRLEARMPLSRDDEVIAAMQQQILRLERRISKLEGHA